MKSIPPKSNRVAIGILKFLAETKQERLLSDVTQKLEQKLLEPRKSKEILVTSVTPLGQKQRLTIQHLIKRVLGQELPVVNHLDKRLLAGFTLRVGDWYLDTSLAQELEILKQALVS